MVLEAEPVRYPIFDGGRQQYILFSYIRADPEKPSSVLEGDREFMKSLCPMQIQRFPKLIRDSRAIKEVPVLANTGLVINIAKHVMSTRFLGPITFEDLVQEGRIGVIRAIPKFNHLRSVKFSTYATWWVRHEMTRTVQECAMTIRLPIHVTENIGKVNRAIGRILIERQEEPTVEMIVQRCNLTEETVKDVFRAQKMEPVSLDKPAKQYDEKDGDELGALIADPTQDVELSYCANRKESQVLALLKESGLDDREKGVITLRFGLHGREEMTLEEVGREFEVTRENKAN